MAKWIYKAVVVSGGGNKDRLAVDGDGRPELFDDHNWRGPEELQKRLSANGLKSEVVTVTIETVKPPAAQ